MKKIAQILKLSAIPALIASLCCLSPVILVLLGFATVSGAASLADTFYGEYKWYFRAAGLLSLAGALLWYFRRTQGICTLDEVVKRRNEIINMVALTTILGTLLYLFFLYVVVHYAGVFLNIWT